MSNLPTKARTALSQRAYSIRTRIKTEPGSFLYHLDAHGQRAYSIRTRIKTPHGGAVIVIVPRQRAYSIRTRIKTGSAIVNWFHFLVVREHIPLEQGLRRRRINQGMAKNAESESIFH